MKNSTKKASVSAKPKAVKRKLTKSALELRKNIAEKLVYQVQNERKFIGELIKSSSGIINTESKLDELFSDFVYPSLWSASNYNSKAECVRVKNSAKNEAKKLDASEYLKSYNRLAKIKQDWKDIKFPNRTKLHLGSATQEGQAKAVLVTQVDRIIGSIQKASQEMLDMKAKKSAISITEKEQVETALKQLEKRISDWKKYANEKLEVK